MQSDQLAIIAIKPDQVPACWGNLRAGVDDCLAHSLGLHSEAELYENLLSGEWLLFVAMFEGEPLASVVASIRQGDCKIFDVGYCWGGQVEKWIEPIYQAFETIGQQLGCGQMAFNGRPGWRMMAKSMGFSINSMTWVKGI